MSSLLGPSPVLVETSNSRPILDASYPTFDIRLLEAQSRQRQRLTNADRQLSLGS
jgi:hypothetical protein